MDIKTEAEKIVKKLTEDETVKAAFKKDPVKTVTDLLGIKLDNDTINQIVAAVKAKVNLDDAKSLLGGLKGILGK